MSPEKEIALRAKYPELFSNRPRPRSIYEQIACGDGWWDLLDTALHLISERVKSAGLKRVRAQQIKEKFGALRIYIFGEDDYISGVCLSAETQSMSICELCGAPGERIWAGYLATLCPTHAQEAKARWNEENEDEDT